MYAAQEMFKTANKVTRPEKALILGFMAGSRGTDPNTSSPKHRNPKFQLFSGRLLCHISCDGKQVFVSSTTHSRVVIAVLFYEAGYLNGK